MLTGCKLRAICSVAFLEAAAVGARSTGAVSKARCHSCNTRAMPPAFPDSLHRIEAALSLQLRALLPPAPQCFVASLERSQRCVKSRARVGGCVPLPAAIEVTDTSRLCC